MKYRNIINYFKDLAERHPDINWFQFGDYDKILGDERDRINYPCMWMESPQAKFIGDTDIHRKTWNVAFVILANSHPEDEQLHEDNIDSCEQIALDIISKILDDFKSKVFTAIELSSIIMDLVSHRDNNNDQGWRVELDIKVKSDLVCNKNIWN